MLKCRSMPTLTIRVFRTSIFHLAFTLTPELEFINMNNSFDKCSTILALEHDDSNDCSRLVETFKRASDSHDNSPRHRLVRLLAKKDQHRKRNLNSREIIDKTNWRWHNCNDAEARDHIFYCRLVISYYRIPGIEFRHFLMQLDLSVKTISYRLD